MKSFENSRDFILLHRKEVKCKQGKYNFSIYLLLWIEIILVWVLVVSTKF